MKRRVLTWGILLALSALLIIGIRGSFADDGGQTGRFKTMDIHVTQYVWELVSNRTGRVVCEVLVDHPNRPTYQETIDICGDQIYPQEPTPTPYGATPSKVTATVVTPTPGPFDLAEYFKTVSWRFVDTRDLVRTVKVPLPELIVSVTFPPNQQPPYQAIIAAYEPVYGQRITGITGVIDGYSFTCASARCEIPVRASSILEFWATSSYGDESRHAQATFREVTRENGTTLELDSVTTVTAFQDACAVAWGIPLYQIPDWAQFPAAPDELNTMKPYQFLAGKLISAGFVNAKDCPGGGLWASGAPNSCGIEKAGAAVVEWQNQFDPLIWESGRSLGVPPRVLKTLFEQESQFWPGNNTRELFEYGLAQLNPVGADVALRWDNELFKNICNGLIYDCGSSYGRLPSWAQATLRGGMMRSIDAQCPECANGINMARAHDSVPVIARTIVANCRQAKYIVNRRGAKLNYEDLWKYTLVSYHSGYTCLSEAFDYAIYNDQPLDWEHVSPYMGCAGSREYVSNFFNSLTTFDQFVLKPPATAEQAQIASEPPTPAATLLPSATPTPTQVPALSHLRVLVYQDRNGNSYPDAGEGVDGVRVTVTYADGQVLSTAISDGIALIDLTGRPVGEDIVVSLPEFFRTQRVRVIGDGEIPVIFRLEQPVVPPALP